MNALFFIAAQRMKAKRSPDEMRGETGGFVVRKFDKLGRKIQLGHSRARNLQGQKFGRWTVLKRAPKNDTVSRAALWVVDCECGNRGVVEARQLVHGKSKSCGCWKLDSMTTHGQLSGKDADGKQKRTREYRIWVGMKARCLNKACPAYHYYGGRGISVCERWRNSFENFFADMGKSPPGKSIDRINNDGNYEPSNCRWATAKEQAHNKRPRGAE